MNSASNFNVPPEQRLEDLLYGNEAEKMFKAVPKSNVNTLRKRLEGNFVLFLDLFEQYCEVNEENPV